MAWFGFLSPSGATDGWSLVHPAKGSPATGDSRRDEKDKDRRRREHSRERRRSPDRDPKKKDADEEEGEGSPDSAARKARPDQLTTTLAKLKSVYGDLSAAGGGAAEADARTNQSSF